METQKYEFFQKSSKLNFDLCCRAEITFAPSIKVRNLELIHQWKGLYEYYTMKIQKCEFHEIKLAKARKNSSVRGHFSEVIYRGSVAVHFRCSLSTMEATSLLASAE